MKKNYLIAGIPIAIYHQENPFFANNLDRYETDLPNDYEITTSIVDEIEHVKLKVQREDSFRRFYQDAIYDYIEVYHQGSNLKYLIKRTKDLKRIEIQMVKAFCKDIYVSEYFLVSMSFLDIAVHNGFLPLHASAIDIRGEGYLFSAPSGVGKSTHTNHYLTLFREAKKINDDKPLVKDNFVYGSPFSGKTSENHNGISTLKGIIFLKQGTTTVVKRLSEAESIQHLIRNASRPSTESGWTNVISVINDIVRMVPMFEASVTIDESSAYITHYELFKERLLVLKPGLVIKQVGLSTIVMPVDQTALEFNGNLTLNSSGRLLFEALSTPQIMANLVQLLMDRFDIDKATAIKDLTVFVEELRSVHLLDESPPHSY